MPVRGPGKASAAWAGKGTGDDSTHPVLSLENLPCHPAVFIELFQRHHLLMGGDLEDTVGGGIYDQIPRLHMCIAVFLNDRRAGVRQIADHTPPGLCRKASSTYSGNPFG